MDFERIDINQCPRGMGNDGPNRFADTARCKKDTTEVGNQLYLFCPKKIIFKLFCFKCEPLHGWGFRRGAYQCRCRPGYRLPLQVRRPFLGEIVERATAEQYYNGFDCLKIGCKFNETSFI